jgi:hypothetical protein
MNVIDLYNKSKENENKVTAEFMLGRGGYPVPREVGGKIEWLMARPVLMKDMAKIEAFHTAMLREEKRESELSEKIETLGRNIKDDETEEAKNNRVLLEAEIAEHLCKIEKNKMEICIDFLHLLLLRNHPTLTREEVADFADSRTLLYGELYRVARGLHNLPDFS